MVITDMACDTHSHTTKKSKENGKLTVMQRKSESKLAKRIEKPNKSGLKREKKKKEETNN